MAWFLLLNLQYDSLMPLLTAIGMARSVLPGFWSRSGPETVMVRNGAGPPIE